MTSSLSSFDRPTRRTQSAISETREPRWEPLADGLREVGIGLAWALVILLPLILVGGGAIYRVWDREERLRTAHERLVAAAPLPLLEVDAAARGRDLFLATCAACHGAAGTGAPGLGRNLAMSAFAAFLDDEELALFLAEGRPAGKPVPMPPRGGRGDLTDDDLRSIVVYLRGLQDPRRLPPLPEPKSLVAAPSKADVEAALAAAGGDDELAEYIASGTKLFNATCIACHGTGGVGVAGNGKPLKGSPFIATLDDDALLAFLKRGRDPSDPANTTGVGMPAKGGNPALDEDDLLDVIAYLRTLK